MKKVYIILSRTDTTPSRFVKLATGSQFTHSSIALVPCKHKLYSFARRRMHNIFVAGFLHEDVDAFVFGKYPESPCAVYELEVSDEAYGKMADMIKCFEKRYSKYKYSFVGAAASQFGIRRKLKYKYTCSQFVAAVLSRAEAISLPKHPSLMKPMDFTKIDGMKLLYSGTIKNISFEAQNEVEYDKN